MPLLPTTTKRRKRLLMVLAAIAAVATIFFVIRQQANPLGRYRGNVTISRSSYESAFVGGPFMHERYELESVDQDRVFSEVLRCNPNSTVKLIRDDGSSVDTPAGLNKVSIYIDCQGEGPGSCVISIQRPANFMENAREWIRGLTAENRRTGPM